MKTSQEFQTEIAQVEEKLRSLDAILDDKIQQFSKLLPAAAEKWILAETQHVIEKNAARIDEIGHEGLKNLKTDISILISTLPEISITAIANSSEWPHKQKLTSDNFHAPHNDPYFDGAFRKTISHLGAILDRHNLLKTEKPEYQTWKKTGMATWIYTINPGFDARNFPPLVDYTNIRKEFTALQEDLKRKQHEQSKARALEMWEQA